LHHGLFSTSWAFLDIMDALIDICRYIRVGVGSSTANRSASLYFQRSPCANWLISMRRRKQDNSWSLSLAYRPCV